MAQSFGKVQPEWTIYLTMQINSQASCLAITLLAAMGVVAKPPPLSIDELRAKTFDTRLEFVRDVEGGSSFDARLVSYISVGLKVHALIATARGSGRPAVSRCWSPTTATIGRACAPA